MKYLHLLRHAKSSWSNPGLDDEDRPLNKRGKRQVKLLAPVLKKHDALDAKIFSSTATRTQQTISDVLAFANVDNDYQSSRKLYSFCHQSLLKWLKKHAPESESILLIGHNPALEELVDRLTRVTGSGIASSFVLPTCSYVKLSLNIDSWRDITKVQAQIEYAVTPNDVSYEEFLKRYLKHSPEFHSANDDTYAETLLRYFQFCEALIPGCRADLDTEFLHQYRVHMRKSRAISDILLMLSNDALLAKRLSILKRHTDVTSSLRDLDVFLEDLRSKYSSSLSPNKDAAKALFSYFEKQREYTASKFLAYINHPDFQVENELWKEFLRSKKFSTMCRHIDLNAFERKFKALESDLKRRIKKLDANSHDEKFHRIRKQIKKYRYLGEMGHSLGGNKLKNIKKLQDNFGRFQDLCIQLDLMSKYHLNTPCKSAVHTSSEKANDRKHQHSVDKLIDHLQREKHHTKLALLDATI